MKKSILYLATFCLIFACKTSQNSSSDSSKTTLANPKEYANTITQAELKEDLFIYASDEFEGRNTGEAGQKKAVDFLRNRYLKLGIESPLGKNDYFQEVPLESSNNPEAKITIDGKDYEFITDFLSFSSYMDTTFSTDNIIYVGFGIEDENYSDYKNIDVKNKVVLIKDGEPKNPDGTYVVSGTTESSKWSNPRQAFTDKLEIAKNKGAKAMLFFSDHYFSLYSNRYKTLLKQGKPGRLSLKAKESDNTMFFLIGNSITLSIKEDIETNNTPSKINKRFNLNYKNNSTPVETENVIAYIKGSEKPEEYIVISAHLDHEGVKDGKIYNGADDDGSGTVAILEIAEAFKTAANNGHNPKRSVVFLHVTGEEKGLLGSRYYTDYDPVFPLDQTVANLNIDMIGRTDPKRENPNRNYVYLIGSDKLSTELHNLSEQVNANCCQIELDYKFNDDNDPNRFYYRSDHYNFAKNNIPVIFYFNGTHDDYHKPTDTPDKIEYDLLENRTRLIFYTAWELANSEKTIEVDKTQ